MGRVWASTRADSNGKRVPDPLSPLCSGDPNAVCRRTDARGITTTYAYNDPLNRLTSKSYSDGTPTAQYSYDLTSVWGESTTNALGRLVLAETFSGSTLLTGNAFEAYDPMGRVEVYRQCTPANCGTSDWRTTYNYDLGGDVTSWTHPAGFTITNTVSAAQRITEITSTRSDSTHPPVLAQNMSYTAWGALSTLQNGCVPAGSCTNVQETYTYNNRLQPTQIQFGSALQPGAIASWAYNYSWPSGQAMPPGCSLSSQSPGNNGNVMGYTYSDSVNSGLNHTALYAYDSLNRLTCAQATGNITYNLDFGHDLYGNTSCSINSYTNGPCPSFAYTLANQISGYFYDAAGNLTSGGGNTYQWDGESRLTSVDSGTTETNTYNALGQQVRLVAPNSNFTWDHLYDPAGQWIARWSNSAWASSGVFQLGGRPFAIYLDQTYFIHVNALGSAAMESGPAGNVIGDTLFYPWGQTWVLGTPEWHFATFQYADAADLYTTPNRQYSNNQGRWLTPDPLGGDVTNPQSLNRYAYVLNNPATLTDPLGLSGCRFGAHSIGPGQCEDDIPGGGIHWPVMWLMDLFQMMSQTECYYEKNCVNFTMWGGMTFASLLASSAAANNGPTNSATPRRAKRRF